MNKNELAMRVNEKMGIPLQKEEALSFVENLFETITEALKRDEEVNITRFGCFYNQKQNSRIGRNIRTGAPVKIEARLSPKFKASITFKKAVLGTKV